MKSYYFVSASLPPINLGEKIEFSFEELMFRLKINLSRKDWKQVVVFRRFLDINNIKMVFLEDPIDCRANLNEQELDQALLSKSILPSYVFDFLDRFELVVDKIKFFPGLLSTYFSEEIKQAQGFLKSYLAFERGWRLVITAIRSKLLGKNIVQELQFEDPYDPMVVHIFAQKDASYYEPPLQFSRLKDIFLSQETNLWHKSKAIAQWRFDEIENLVKKPLFSIDGILSYMARLLILEQWNELDRLKGSNILEGFVG